MAPCIRSNYKLLIGFKVAEIILFRGLRHNAVKLSHFQLPSRGAVQSVSPVSESPETSSFTTRIYTILQVQTGCLTVAPIRIRRTGIPLDLMYECITFACTYRATCTCSDLCPHLCCIVFTGGFSKTALDCAEN